MSRRTPLLRMIILVSLLILFLIIVSTRIINRDDISPRPNFKERFFWQDKNIAYSLLLHSITINGSSFSAYSSKWDSLMIFPALPSELRSIKNKLKANSFKKQQCSSCHID